MQILFTLNIFDGAIQNSESNIFKYQNNIYIFT
jgi:hypothetical protein